MWIITHEIFLLDFPFKIKNRLLRCHINFGGVIDTTEIVSAMPLIIGYRFSGVINTR
jgi:hypothetical protein